MNYEGYWRDRALEREKHWYDLTTRELNEEVKAYFEQSLEKICREIESLYARYAEENKLTMSEARRLIRGKEFRVWRRSLEEYVELSKSDSDILKELNTLAMRSRITRLDALHARTLMEVADLCEKLEKFEDSHQYKAYVENYYGSLYDIHKKVGLSTPPVIVNSAQVSKVIRTVWSGGNYSARIWKNGEKLALELKTAVTEGIHRGLSVQKLSGQLSRRLEVSYNKAERLIRTELNWVQTKASLDAMESAGLESYQYMAALDRRTCARCGSLDGEIFPLSEKEQGENAPPLHPRCRCTICVSFSEGKRSAKVDGKRVKVPADMSFAEWRAVYVDRGLAAGNIDWDNSKGIAPRLIEQIKFSPELIQKTLEKYEKQIVNSTYEHAVIITSKGEVYHCAGDEHGIKKEYFYQIQDKLKGAHVTHNHPKGASENDNTFSDDDIDLFLDFDIKRLRGIDEKYIYELNRNKNDNELAKYALTEIYNIGLNFEDYHTAVMLKALIVGFGYKRWLR